jgi:hypothetical protein
MKILGAFLLLCLCASCSMVVSKQPVGSLVVNPEKAGITGTWVNDTGDKCTLVMKDPKAGSVVVLDDSEDIEFFVRETGGVLFANMKVEDEDYYAWAELKLKNNELHIRHPDLDKFSKLIADQKLKARIIQEDRFVGEQNRQIVTSTDIVIDDPKGTWVEMLAAGKLGNVYDEEDVQILKRAP